MRKNKNGKKQKKTGTKEWAGSNENILYGCQHGCLYCYACSMCVRHKKTTVDNWETPILDKNRLNKGLVKRKKTIMFPTTHDIHPENLNDSIAFLKRLLKPGNKVLIVSKPHLECVKKMCEERKEYKRQIVFRFTIGSADPDVLKFWEPFAPALEERLACLQFAKEQGYETSVSCEPMLDNNVEAVIKKVSPYVTEKIWVGKPKELIKRMKINKKCNSEQLQKAEELLADLSDDRIMELYKKYKDNPIIAWKDTIQEVVDRSGLCQMQ